ncbi:MAG: carbon-nitrogen hydrolase family protein [Planctomycetota bacterium]
MLIAAAQIAPVLLDRSATLGRVVASIDAASKAGASLVAFGEVMVPGYPVWTERTGGARFDNALQKTLHARYLEQAIDLEAGDLEPVQRIAADTKTTVVIGIAERPQDRGGHTLYASCVTVGPDGSIASSHRKLMPTYEERLSWGPGDAHGLVTHRFETLAPFTLGSLNCWENWMPLPRAALYAQGEDLHVAIWPGCDHNTRDITRFLAREGRSYVLSASARLSPDDIPADLPARDDIVGVLRDDGLFHNGGSAIAGPDGEWITPPDTATDGLVLAEISHARVLEERHNFDPSGHYARPELLGLDVDRRRITSARFHDDSAN